MALADRLELSLLRERVQQLEAEIRTARSVADLERRRADLAESSSRTAWRVGVEMRRPPADR
jgi:hypothetical protein